MAAAVGAIPTSRRRLAARLDISGGLVGGTLGYNWQMNQIVFGLETDLDWSNIRGSATCGGLLLRDQEQLARHRRAAASATRSIASCLMLPAAWPTATSRLGRRRRLDRSDTKTGWTFGGGVEAAIAGPWTAKVEYLYVDLGHGDSTLGSTRNFNTNIVRAGLNYRF